MQVIRFLAAGLLVISLAGCLHAGGDNSGELQSYPAPVIEPAWIRDGEPIEFDGHQWYAVDDYAVLQDSEVYEVGEYRDVQIFVEKIQTKPYSRIYTKFAPDKFRYYERRDQDDDQG